MKIKILRNTLILTVALLTLTTGVFAEGALITSMDDLSELNLNEETASSKSLSDAQSTQSDEDIVILYSEPKDNNIGELGLEQGSFSAGVSLNSSVDVLRVADIEEETVDSLISEIEAKDGVTAVDRDGYATAMGLPNDPCIGQEYYYAQTGADKVWNTASGSRVKVAVLDSGVDTGQEDMWKRIEQTGNDYLAGGTHTIQSPQGHGNMVSSILIAQSDNSIGMSGITGLQDVQVVPYRVLDDNGAGRLSLIASALEDVSRRPDIGVVNLSLGFYEPNEVVRAACQKAYEAGKVIVAASGNDNYNYSAYPAAYETVVSVGAVDENKNRCKPEIWGPNQGSNYSPEVELSAPGHNLVCVSSAGGPNYGIASGTSFATSIVSGACALVLAKNPSLSPDQVRNILATTAEDLGTPGRDVETGYGLVRIDQALSVSEAQSPATENLSLNETSLVLTPSQRARLEATPSSNLTWTSADPQIAQVSADGEVVAIGCGRTSITVSMADNPRVAASCAVSVEPFFFTYTAQVEDIGWMGTVGNGGVAGTVGQAKKLETLRFNLEPPALEVISQAHIQNVGDTPLIREGENVGTVGFNQGLEAVRFALGGGLAGEYNIYYRAHVSNYGWTAWTGNGGWCGTKGQSLQLEAVQVLVAPSGVPAPAEIGDVGWAFLEGK